MKKTIFIGVFLVLSVYISLNIISHSQSRHISYGSIAQYKPKNDLTLIALNKCHEVGNFTKNLPSNESGIIYKKIINIDFSHDPYFLTLKKASLINNECGAIASTFLVNYYSNIGLSEKSNESHNRVLNFARSGNPTAILNLCGSYDTLTTIEQKTQNCRIIIDSSDKSLHDDVIRFTATEFLSEKYFKNRQSDELVMLYKKSDFKDVLFSSYKVPYSVVNLAYIFYKEKNFQQAMSLYKHISEFDDTGITEFIIAEMYVNGEGSSIDLDQAENWYLNSLKKNHDSKTRPDVMNGLCNVYDKKFKYVEAFKCYHKAACSGSVFAQANLGRLYALGHGTIQDIKKGYAWTTIATVQGLENKSNQLQAENLNHRLIYELKMLDKSVSQLNQAQILSQEYYNKYVLRKD